MCMFMVCAARARVDQTRFFPRAARLVFTLPEALSHQSLWRIGLILSRYTQSCHSLLYLYHSVAGCYRYNTHLIMWDQWVMWAFVVGVCRSVVCVLSVVSCIFAWFIGLLRGTVKGTFCEWMILLKHTRQRKSFSVRIGRGGGGQRGRVSEGAPVCALAGSFWVISFSDLSCGSRFHCLQDSLS